MSFLRVDWKAEVEEEKTHDVCGGCPIVNVREN